MRGLSMVNSYSIIVTGWDYVRYGFPRSWLILTLLANVALSLVLAAHIDSHRGRCTMPVEAKLMFQGGAWSAPGRGIVSALLNLPAGWALLLSMASCSFLWYVDNGEELRRSWKHRILLALQVACTMGLLWMMAQ